MWAKLRRKRCARCGKKKRMTFEHFRRDHKNDTSDEQRTRARTARKQWRSSARNRCWDNARRHISRALGDGRYSYMKELIGMNRGEFLQYLQNCWSYDMNWSNYATLWNLDLVEPMSAFDFGWEADRVVCFNWRNWHPSYVCVNETKASKQGHPYRRMRRLRNPNYAPAGG